VGETEKGIGWKRQILERKWMNIANSPTSKFHPLSTEIEQIHPLLIPFSLIPFSPTQRVFLVMSLQVPNVCTDLGLAFLYISMLGTCSKFVRKNKMLALGVCLQQPCPSAGRMFAASRSHLNLCWTFVSIPQKMNLMKCFVSWIPLNTHVPFNPTQPYLKGGPFL